MNDTIATVGDNCIDRYLAPVGMSTVGGNAVNVAVQLVRLGRRVAYFGAVGTDAEGLRTVEALRANSVDIAHVRRVPGNTAHTDLAIGDDGDRTIAFEDFGVCLGYRPSEQEIPRLKGMRHVHLGWLDDGGQLRRALTAAGVSVSQDLAVNPEGEDLAIAFASAGSARERAKQLARDALGAGAQLAVVTMGAAGSLATDGERYAETGSLPATVADTTGAGDTFIAGFIDAHLRGLGLQVCLEMARDAAAKTCGHLGGFPQAPIAI